MLYEVDVELV